MPGFEVREHTADIILRVWGDSLESLFEQAARGLYSCIGELAWRPGEPIELDLSAGATDDLLRDFLAELLFIFETGHAVIDGRCFTELTQRHVHLTAHRCPIDLARCRFDREVKAVTYHGLHITREGGEFQVDLVLDI